MGLSNYLPNSRINQSGVCTSSTRPASPYEGQVIYETDTDRTLVWNGTAWVDVSTGKAGKPGLVFIKEQALSGTSTNVTSCFSSDFTDYLVIGDSLSWSGSGDIYFRLLVGTTAQTATNYYWAYNGINQAGTAVSSAGATQTLGYTGTSNSGANNLEFGLFSLIMSNPQKTKRTTCTCSATSYVANYYHYHGMVWYDNTTACDGIQFLTNSAVTMGGTIRVYGYNQ